jgi:hypothetical protein
VRERENRQPLCEFHPLKRIKIQREHLIEIIDIRTAQSIRVATGLYNKAERCISDMLPLTGATARSTVK